MIYIATVHRKVYAISLFIPIVSGTCTLYWRILEYFKKSEYLHLHNEKLMFNSVKHVFNDYSYSYYLGNVLIMNHVCSVLNEETVAGIIHFVACFHSSSLCVFSLVSPVFLSEDHGLRLRWLLVHNVNQSRSSTAGLRWCWWSGGWMRIASIVSPTRMMDGRMSHIFSSFCWITSHVHLF